VISGYANLLPYRQLILYKAWCDFRAEAERTLLGPVWWILDPLISMAIYYLVFAVFLRRGTEDFVPFLIVGILGYRLFEGSVKRMGNSIYGARSLCDQVALRKLVLPVTSLLTSLYEFAFKLPLLFGVLALFGFRADLHYAAFPAVLAVEVLLTCAVGVALAAFVPFVPDLASAAAYVLRVGFFLSGVMYSGESLPAAVQPWFWLNPVSQLIHAHRQVLMYGQWPDPRVLGAIAAASALGILCAVGLMARFDGLYAKRMMR
jgi:lipopolysaccharide transport system permease protein